MAAALNPLVSDLGSPPIPEAQGWTRLYGGDYGPLLDLSQAAPGAPPSPGLLERLAASAGSAAGAKYGPITGDPDLREAYAAEVAALYGGRVGAADIAITAGCNLAFVVAMMTFARAGEAVLLPVPWYFNHQMSLAMLGIEPRPLPCRPETGFVPSAQEAEALIDERVRAIVLVSPNNPTGAVYPAAVIDAFAGLCRRRGLRLVIDETYRDFLPAGASRAHDLFTDEGWRETVVQLYSFSKAYGIPGHRLGAITANAELLAHAAKLLDCLQICPSRPGQAALPWAIDALGAWRQANRADINRRAEAFGRSLAGLPGWRVDALGAYFAYLRHPFRGVSAHAVAERLTIERGVLCLPGSYFGPGQDEHLRVAFANVGTEAIESLGARLAGWA